MKDLGLWVLQLHSATLRYPTLPYPQCFEGMKAYVDDKQQVRLFRPDLNMQRLHDSMVRLNLPGFDKEQYLKCIKELVLLDRDWIPSGEGYSLYLRPTGISTHVRDHPGAGCTLAIRTARQLLHFASCLLRTTTLHSTAIPWCWPCSLC